MCHRQSSSVMFYTEPLTPAADQSPFECRTYTKRGVDTTLAHIISLHAANNVIDATYLSSDSVTPSGEQLGDTCRVEASLGQTESCSETGTTSTPGQSCGVSDETRHCSWEYSHNDGVVFVFNERILPP